MQELKPDRGKLVADAIAGLTFAVVNIPQAMANALLANVNPVLGLYTLIVATPVAALATSSVFMNVSTTSALSVAAGDTMAAYPEADRVIYLSALVLLTGIIQFFLGVLRLGSLVRFVANSVMVGFITGIAALIVLGQIGDLTGYHSQFSNKILQLFDTFLHLGEIDWATFAIGLLTIGLIVLFSFTRFRKVGMVIALIVSTLVAYLLDSESVAVVGDITAMPDQLLNFALPSLSAMLGMLPAALALAIIGLVQGAGVGQNYPNPDGTFPDTSRDFVGQGLANMATSFFQGIPAGGSMSGTAVTVNSGARSRWANIFAGLFVIPLVLLVGDFVLLIPMASLAGLLIVVGFQSFKVKDVVTVWQTGKVASAAMVLTFIATLTLPLQFAVFSGVIVSLLLHVFNSSNKVTVVQFVLVDKGFPIETAPDEKLSSDDVTVLYVYGSLFFASATKFEEQLPQVNDSEHAVVVLLLRGVDDIGSTMIGVLQRYNEGLREQNGRLLLGAVSPRIKKQVIRTGLAAEIGENNIFLAEPQLGKSMNQAIAAGQAWVQENKQKNSRRDNGTGEEVS